VITLCLTTGGAQAAAGVTPDLHKEIEIMGK
jgi:hypothetical protein